MTFRNDIWIELKEMKSSLAGMSTKMPFEVPAGYFDQLSDTTLNLIKAEAKEEPFFKSSKSMPFSLPEGYFENLSNQILQKTTETPGWDDPDRRMPMELPEGYFENLPQQILEAVKKNKPVRKTIALPIWKGIRWAAAAILISGIGIGSYHIFPTAIPEVNQKLTKVPVDSIHAYVRQNIDEFDSEMLEKKLASNDVQLNMTNNQINRIETEEIIQYLNETEGHEKTETE
jgi:hypothetical protein